MSRWKFQREDLRRKRAHAAEHLTPYSKQRSLASYEPIDEVLANPSVRILRALRWFDWATMDELFEALEVNEDNHSSENNAYRAALRRHRTAGRVSGDGIRTYGRAYCITPVGRAWLDEQLKRAEVVP